MKIVPKSALGPTWPPRPFLNRFWFNFGSNLGPSWGGKMGSCWGHVGQKMILGGSWRHSKSTKISNTFRDPLGTDFGTILGSKIEPKSVQDRSQERSWSKCKDPQNHRQGRCFWGSEGLNIDQNSIKIVSKNDLTWRGQSNTGKWSKKLPRWNQNRPKLGLSCNRKSSWSEAGGPSWLRSDSGCDFGGSVGRSEPIQAPAPVGAATTREF